MSLLGAGKANEVTFQEDMIRQLVANGWKRGNPNHYNRELALYPEDLLGFVKGHPGRTVAKILPPVSQ